jgi:hypothetical protein
MHALLSIAQESVCRPKDVVQPLHPRQLCLSGRAALLCFGHTWQRLFQLLALPLQVGKRAPHLVQLGLKLVRGNIVRADVRQVPEVAECRVTRLDLRLELFERHVTLQMGQLSVTARLLRKSIYRALRVVQPLFEMSRADLIVDHVHSASSRDFHKVGPTRLSLRTDGQRSRFVLLPSLDLAAQRFLKIFHSRAAVRRIRDGSQPTIKPEPKRQHSSDDRDHRDGWLPQEKCPDTDDYETPAENERHRARLRRGLPR